MGDRIAAWVSGIADRVFGPVFTLDAVRAGRRASTFLIRWGYLFVLLGIVWVYKPSLRSDSSSGLVNPNVLTRFAEEFFWVYSVTQFLLLAALTPSLTAGSITDEKERKTLHFLLATDLSGREIVFGKLAARVGALCTLVLAGLPIIAFMQLFGGIEPRLLLVSVSMTLATVISLAAVSVAASVLLPRTRDAVVLAYVLPVGYLFISSIAWGELRRNSDPAWRELVEVVATGNPFYTVNAMGRDLGGEAIPSAALWYVGFHAIVAILGIGLAAWRLRASVRREGATASAPKTGPAMMLAWLIGQRSEARKHPPVGNDPVRWREVHVEPNSSGGIFHRFMVATVLFAVFFPLLRIGWDFVLNSFEIDTYRYSRYDWSPWKELQESIKFWVCSVTCGLGCIMLLRATVRGASAVAGERDRDTWVSLLTTPLPLRDILLGKWAGCVLGQKDAAILLGVVWTIGVVTFSVNPFALAFTAVALWVYLRAFAWFGISCSVTARNSRAAIGKAVPLSLLMGGGYWLFLGCCCAGAAFGGGDLIGVIAAFVAGGTPPFVLAILPAFGIEYLKDMSGRESLAMLAAICGLVVGTFLWSRFAKGWANHSHTALATEARPLGKELLERHDTH